MHIYVLLSSLYIYIQLTIKTVIYELLMVNKINILFNLKFQLLYYDKRYI